MQWTICFWCSLACLVGSLVGAFIKGRQKYKNSRILTPLNIMFGGVVISTVILFIPTYSHLFSKGDDNLFGIIETVLVSIHNMIRLFIVDGDFQFVVENMPPEIDAVLGRAYGLLFSVLFVAAPLMTFGFVLSFFKNLSALAKYMLNYRSDVFVFSGINDKSAALAQSLVSGGKKERTVVFCSVNEDDEDVAEYIGKTREMGAICFKKDINSINFSLHSKRADISFFMMDEDQTDNTEQTLALISTYKNRGNTNLYLFSDSAEAEFILMSAYADDKDEPVMMRVRRINEIRALINRDLYDHGADIFENAAPDEVSGTKHISAVIVGLGKYGVEMTKALTWFCQMDGYSVTVNSFDVSETAASEFAALCPELVDPRINGSLSNDGESRYELTVHSGVDINSCEFAEKLAAILKPTFVFVALGDDEKNIAAAVRLRTLCERNGCHPPIKAVIYHSGKKNVLENIANFKNQKYNIDFIGDVESSFSEDVILNSEVERAALARHLKWGDESDFWKYSYNYNSSVASAIHRKMKIICEIPGADKTPAERTEDELWGLRILEHRRWNTYMRSEGYSYAPKRNDLAKVHHCLVPFDELSLEDQIKDDD